MLPGLRGDIERAGLQSALEHVLVYMHLRIRMLDTAPWCFDQTRALTMSKLQGFLAGVLVAFPDPLKVCVIRPKCLSFVLSLFVLSRRGAYLLHICWRSTRGTLQLSRRALQLLQPGQLIT